MALDRCGGNSGRSSAEQHLPVTGSTLLFPKAKGSKRYRIELGCSRQAEEAFERWQRSLNRYETNAGMVHRLLNLVEAQQLPPL